MSRQDDIAAKAVRKSTLKSLKDVILNALNTLFLAGYTVLCLYTSLIYTNKLL